MSITLDGRSLTIESLVRIARDGEQVALDPQALERIRLCRVMLEKKLAAHEIMYGINTGIGEFSEVVLTDEQVGLFQRALVYNHAAGIGDPAPHRGRAGGDGRPHQRPRPRQLRLSAPRSPRPSSRCSTRASPRWSARRARWAPAATSPPWPSSPWR